MVRRLSNGRGPQTFGRGSEGFCPPRAPPQGPQTTPEGEEGQESGKGIWKKAKDTIKEEEEAEMTSEVEKSKETKEKEFKFKDEWETNRHPGP